MTKISKIVTTAMLALAIAVSTVAMVGCGETADTGNTAQSDNTASKNTESKKEVESQAPKAEAITLKNPVIEEYIRRVFEVGDGKEITTQVAARVRGISLTGECGTDFSDLAYFPNLGGIDLKDTDISDISPILENCKELSTLTLLGGNEKLVDLSPLTNNDTIDILTISDEKAYDWSPLSTMKKVAIFEIRRTDVQDYSFLTSMKSLNKIILLDAGTLDSKVLSGLSNLFEIDLREMKFVASDLSFAASESLSNITINDCGFSDISGLPAASMKNLSKLDLSSNGIKDITVLGDLASIRTLKLNGNDITDISALAKIKDKIGDRIELEHNKNLKDLSGLDDYVSAFW